MAISHADHTHPNTPAARAACRKQLANGGLMIQSMATGEMIQVPKPVEMTVVPRKRGDGGVVRGMKAAKPRTAKGPAADFSEDAMIAHNRSGDQGVVQARKAKAYERPIRTTGDLPADIPANLVRTIEAAWDLGYPVIEGLRLNEAETRILIGGVVAQVSLVFNAGGDSGVFVRSLTSSVTHRADSGSQALALAAGDEDWPWMSHGKAV